MNDRRQMHCPKGHEWVTGGPLRLSTHCCPTCGRAVDDHPDFDWTGPVPPTVRFRLPSRFLEDAEPIFDDARGSNIERDPALVAMKRVVDAIDAGTVGKHGVIYIDADLDHLATIQNEAEYRAGACRDMAASSFDNHERMPFLAAAQSHVATARRAAAASAALAVTS